MAGERDRALFSLMYNTGARLSEAIGLRVGEVASMARRSRTCMERGAKTAARHSGVRPANLIRN